MRTNILLLLVFISFLFFGSTQYNHGIVGLTKLNGEGCVCHNISPDQTVHVWIEGPDSLQINQTAVYTLFLTGGPAVSGGFNAASGAGILFPADTTSKKIDQELTHNLAKPFTGDTVKWQFEYTAPASFQWDTIYSVAQSVNNDGIPNSADKWNYGANFPVKIVPFVPVELASFTASLVNNSVKLEWVTASETNNSGFDIEVRTGGGVWNKISFVNGAGTTTKNSYYSFIDNNTAAGLVSYRLKQIDFSGVYSYSPVVEIDKGSIQTHFALEQNYPNPFNPVTKIRYTLPENITGITTLKIYDLTGKEAAVLINEAKSAGTYELDFNASELSSGVYIYTLQSGGYSLSRKLIVLK